MKEINIFIRKDDLAQVTTLLQKHGIGGLSFYEINGTGRTRKEAIPEMVRSYMTGRMITPDYVKRTKVEVVVADSKAKEIIDEILNNLSPGKEAHGMIFVRDLAEAYEIGTKASGETVLSPK
jgi:nitrogen regulatory protein P-II 1